MRLQTQTTTKHKWSLLILLWPSRRIQLIIQMISLWMTNTRPHSAHPPTQEPTPKLPSGTNRKWATTPRCTPTQTHPANTKVSTLYLYHPPRTPPPTLIPSLPTPPILPPHAHTQTHPPSAHPNTPAYQMLHNPTPPCPPPPLIPQSPTQPLPLPNKTHTLTPLCTPPSPTQPPLPPLMKNT